MWSDCIINSLHTFEINMSRNQTVKKWIFKRVGLMLCTTKQIFVLTDHCHYPVSGWQWARVQYRRRSRLYSIQGQRGGRYTGPSSLSIGVSLTDMVISLCITVLNMPVHKLLIVQSICVTHILVSDFNIDKTFTRLSYNKLKLMVKNEITLRRL